MCLCVVVVIKRKKKAAILCRSYSKNFNKCSQYASSSEIVKIFFHILKFYSIIGIIKVYIIL